MTRVISVGVTGRSGWLRDFSERV